jgi:hypothetical protein
MVIGIASATANAARVLEGVAVVVGARLVAQIVG